MKEFKLLDFAFDEEEGFWFRVVIGGNEIEMTLPAEHPAVLLLHENVSIRVGRVFREIFEDRVDLTPADEGEN
jgi:hypothetical protein